jgi:hypothetical protein
MSETPGISPEPPECIRWGIPVGVKVARRYSVCCGLLAQWQSYGLLTPTDRPSGSSKLPSELHLFWPVTSTVYFGCSGVARQSKHGQGDPRALEND